MFIRNLSLLVVLFLPFLLRNNVLTKSLYFEGAPNPAVENTIQRREGIFQRERVWYSVAIKDLTSMQLISAPAPCSDPLDRCNVRVTLSFSPLSNLQLRVAAITDSHQELRFLECARLTDGDFVRLHCAGEIPSGITVRGVALFPSAIDEDSTFNRIRIDPQTLSWSLGSQVAILAALVGIAALIIRYSLQAAGAVSLMLPLAQGYAGMFALSCTLYIPRVCKPGLGGNTIESEGRSYYLMKLTGIGSNAMLTLGEHALVCGAILVALGFTLITASRRARVNGHHLRILGSPVGERGVWILLGLLALLFPGAMLLYPRALTDLWALALSLISCLLLYNLLSALQTKDDGYTSLQGFHAKPSVVLGGGLLAGVILVAFLNSTIFSKQPLLIDSRVLLVYAQSLLSGVVAPTLDDASFNLMQGHILIRNGAWFPVQPPGHLALLMVSSTVGLGHIAGVFGFAVSFALLISLAKVLKFSQSGIYIAAALFITSPLIVLMHAEYMTHISAEIFLLLALLGAYKAVETNPLHATRWMVVFGAAAGAMAVTRPLTALGMLCPITIWLIAHPHLRRFREWGCALAAGIPFMAVYLAYNKVTTGSYLMSGYESSFGTSHNPGFGVDPQGELFTIARGFRRMIGQLGSLSANALIVPIPLFLVALLGYRIPRLRPLLASALGLPLAYVFYWHDGDPYFRPRFFFESISLWCLLIGETISALVLARWESLTPKHRQKIFAACAALILFFVVVSLLFPISDTLLFYKTAAARANLS